MAGGLGLGAGFGDHERGPGLISLSDIADAGGFPLIAADPAWAYKDSGVRGGTDPHYEKMTLAEICCLPVDYLSARDSVLLLWSTRPLMMEAHAVGRAWSFRYVTEAFTWIKVDKAGKPRIGGGHWTRANSEGCLLFVKGKGLERLDKGVSQVILSARDDHSSKPPEFYERVARLFGDVPRAELFARDRVEGWLAWGNQVPGGSDFDLLPSGSGEDETSSPVENPTP